MLIQLPRVLSAEQLARVHGLLDGHRFEDGTATATGAAAQVKRNLQLPPDGEAARAAGTYLLECLSQSPLYRLATQARAFAPPLFSRYLPGMSYGAHLDAPLLHRGGTIRSDLATTVFLNAPTDYDGGELVIELGSHSVSVKAEAGDCIVYPATTFHRVAEVTRGERVVSALWAQSLIRDPGQREILYDLGCALQALDAAGGGAAVDRARRSYNNLLRMWAEL